MYLTTANRAIATTVSKCDRTPLLIDPELLKFLRVGFRCKVQLASDELELDSSDIPVPKDYRVIELMVLDDKPETIKLLVAAIPELKGYTIIDHWQTIEENPF